MAVAHDASSEFAQWTTATPVTQTHTPTGTPRGVVVKIVQSGASTDEITAVTYGGVSMKRVGFQSDTATEIGAVYSYFLGASIPTGAQTVSISTTGAGTAKWAATATVTASTDTEVGSTGASNFGDPANPLAIMPQGDISGLVYGGIFSGTDAPGNLTMNAGMSALQDNDFGAASARMDRQTSAGSGTFNYGYTLGAEDTAMVAIGIQEVQTGLYAQGHSLIVAPNATTTAAALIPGGILTGQPLVCVVISRDHTSGTALPTCTDDDSGGNTWTLVGNTTNRQVLLFTKLATADTGGKLVTIAGAVGSLVFGITGFSGADGAVTNASFEENASGNETHAGFTPDEADSIICFGVGNPTNDTGIEVTAMACTDPGTLEPEWWTRASTGGNDCYLIFTGKPQSGGPTATGNFTWSQTDSVTRSLAFAVSPADTDVTGTGASTLDGVTSAGTGVETFTGSGASTLDGVTSAGSGIVAEAVTGTGSSTLDGVTSSGSGTVLAPITGSGASTLDGVTSAGTGTLGISGSGAATLAGVTSEGSGLTANPLTGTGASTLDGVTSTGVGSVLLPGQISNVECELVGPEAECVLVGPAGACDSFGPMCVTTMED